MKRNVKVIFHPILNVKKGYFLNWKVDSSSSNVYGIIEFEDGSIVQCDPQLLVFKEKNISSELVKIKFPRFQESVIGYIHQVIDDCIVVELENGAVKLISSQWIERSQRVA